LLLEFVAPVAVESVPVVMPELVPPVGVLEFPPSVAVGELVPPLVTAMLSIEMSVTVMSVDETEVS
jgi:hypothetical protein